MLFANCHFHSTFSDGEYHPSKLVELAKSLGHRALILTDHDTVRGTYFLQNAARKAGMLSLLGCEFSTKGLGSSFHLVGIDFNPENAAMRKLLARAAAKQTERSHILFDRGLERGTLRPGITWQDVLDFFPDNDYYCNNQVFFTMQERGIYKPEDYPEFFYNNFAPPSSVNREIEELTGLYTPDVEEVVHTILAAGGVPVIAHPNKREKYVDDLIRMGVMGFETRHPDLTEGEPEFYDQLCTERNLYKLGGTDHSAVLGGLAERMAHLNVPVETGYVTEEDFMKLYRRELG